MSSTADGDPLATGKLIEGGGASGGMATWADVKAQAQMLGIQLTDPDVGNVPLLATDPYGEFIPGADGLRADRHRRRRRRHSEHGG